MVSVRPNGWQAWLTEPDTSRILPLEVLDDPEINPSINTLPKIRVPVPKSDVWQSFSTHPDMSVYLDGTEQPIDELLRPVDPRGRAEQMLEGRGGVELLDVVAKEFDTKERHTAAQEIIDNETTYNSDVPTPSFDLLEDEDMQDPTTTSEFNDVLTLASDEPVKVASGSVELEQTGFFKEAENADSSTGGRGTTGSEDDNYSGADGEVLESTGDAREWNVTPQHDIPADDVGIQVRRGLDSGSQDNPAFTWTFNSNTVDTLGTAGTTLGVLGWDDIGTGVYEGSGYTGGDLTAGNTYTLRVEVDDGGGASDRLFIDGIVVYDEGDRWTTPANFTFDNTTDGNDALDGPETYQPYDVEFDDATTPFAILAATVTVTMDDTGNDQRLQLSNDRGQNWEPSDNSENNTSTVTVDPFASESDRVRIRVRLSDWEDGGDATTTPVKGHSTQTLQSYDLDADIEEKTLLLDYSEEQSIQDHLTDIVGSEFFWSYRILNGNQTVSIIQPESQNSADTPELIDAEITKDLELFHEFTVRGANKRVQGEPFTGNTSFVSLGQTDIRPGSETVYNPADGTQFTRREDYEVNWQAGEIKILAPGAMSSGTTYEITYRHDIKGTYTDPNAPAGYRSRTVDIPAVTSTRNAEQIAYVLVEVDGFNAPRWIADLTVPPSVTDFDVVDSLPLDRLDLPAGAGPLEIEEPPRVTPEGTQFRLGTRQELESRIAQLRRTTQQVARRSG